MSIILIDNDSITLQAGEICHGNGNTIRCVGPITVKGSHNKIYTHFSDIQGDYNEIYGNNNYIRGKYNTTHGVQNFFVNVEPKQSIAVHPLSNVFHQILPPLSQAKKPQAMPVEKMKELPSEEELKYDENTKAGDDEALICVICLERRRKCVIRPCKHFSLCIACSSDSLKECPSCRKPIEAIERLYT